MSPGEARPDPLELLRRLAGDGRRCAMLRVYLGYARGCGATTAMLDEARRRRSRGTDVVVAAYRVHGDPDVALAGLAVLGANRPLPAERSLGVTPALARNADVVCVDDLAASDAEGSPCAEAVPGLLAAGITVLATLHVLSVRSAATAFSSVAPAEGPLVEDSFLAMADEVEMVDVPPLELVDRVRESAILTPAQLARAMQSELRPGLLGALRETAFRMISDHSGRQLAGLLRETKVDTPWEGRGRVVLCLSPQPGLEGRIRQTARRAAAEDASFAVVTVHDHPFGEEEKTVVGAYSALTHQLGGEFVNLNGRNVAAALTRYLRDTLATEVILGHRRRPRRVLDDTTSELIRLLSGVDVHILRADDPA